MMMTRTKMRKMVALMKMKRRKRKMTGSKFTRRRLLKRQRMRLWSARIVVLSFFSRSGNKPSSSKKGSTTSPLAVATARLQRKVRRLNELLSLQ